MNHKATYLEQQLLQQAIDDYKDNWYNKAFDLLIDHAIEPADVARIFQVCKNEGYNLLKDYVEFGLFVCEYTTYQLRS